MKSHGSRLFELELPLEVTRSGFEPVAFAGLTQRIASDRVSFFSVRNFSLSAPIDYVITLQSERDTTVLLYCTGIVLRSERLEGPDMGPEFTAYRIGASMERHRFMRAC
jgi:hypothetical protein